MSLLDTASLILTPNGYKASKLYSVKPTSGDGDMVVSRGTSATRVNSSGLIELMPIDVPRLDYTGGGCPSILVEPARTNVVLHSGDLSQSVWSKTNYALTSTTAIQGLTTTRITKNATDNAAYNGTGGRNIVGIVGTFAAGVKTLTWLIRKGNTDKVGFLINDVIVGVLTSVNCEFNFNTKTFTNVSLGLTASFENPTTDVYKITLTINDIGISTNKRIWIAPINSSNNTVDGGYLDFAFAQWEAGSNATSYIPTTTLVAGTTRVADVISKTGISSLIGQTEGTIFMDLNFTNVGVDKYIIVINNTANTNSIAIRRLSTGAIRIVLTATTTSGTTSQSSAVLANGNYKIAYRYISGSIKLYINGALSFTETPTFTFGAAIDNIKLGMSNGNTEQLNDTINSFQLYQTALDNDQCISLTTL